MTAPRFTCVRCGYAIDGVHVHACAGIPVAPRPSRLARWFRDRSALARLGWLAVGVVCTVAAFVAAVYAVAWMVTR